MTLIRTRRFTVELLTSKKDWFWPGWRWRPRFTRPVPRSRCLTWGTWHLLVWRAPTAAERRADRAHARAVIEGMRRDGWEMAR